MGVLLYAAAVLWLLFAADRSAPLTYLLPVLLTVPGYLLAVRRLSWRRALALGVGLRVAAVFAFPLLSDDVYRFLWDGELWLAGYNPLDFIPADSPEAFAKTHGELLALMNSRSYFTVYPPLSQLLFVAAAKLSTGAYWGSVALKLLLLAAEVGLLALLFRLDETPTQSGARAYWLHPLVVVEVAGNAHFESFALLGVVGAYALLRQTGRPVGLSVGAAAGALAAAGLVKLVPLLLAPAFAFRLLFGKPRLNWLGAVLFGSLVAFVFGLGLALMFLGADVTGFGESLDLYFRSFEFNGSLYTLARGLGEWYKGYNWIARVGPSLALAGTLSIVGLSAYRGRRSLHLPTTLLWAMGVYLLCATTVHPWYFVYLLVLAALTPYRWPYLLGFTAFLSYVAYVSAGTEVPGWVLTLEYVPVLGLAAWEVAKLKDGGAHARGPLL